MWGEERYAHLIRNGCLAKARRASQYEHIAYPHSATSFPGSDLAKICFEYQALRLFTWPFAFAVWRKYSMMCHLSSSRSASTSCRAPISQIALTPFQRPTNDNARAINNHDRQPRRTVSATSSQNTQRSRIDARSL